MQDAIIRSVRFWQLTACPKKSAAPHSQNETDQRTGGNEVFTIVRLFLDLPLLQVLDPVT